MDFSPALLTLLKIVFYHTFNSMDIRICSSECNKLTFYPTQSPHGNFKNFEIINHYGCQFSLLIQTYYFKLLFQLFFLISDRLNLIGRSELLTLIRKCQYIYFKTKMPRCGPWASCSWLFLITFDTQRWNMYLFILFFCILVCINT